MAVTSSPETRRIDGVNFVQVISGYQITVSYLHLRTKRRSYLLSLVAALIGEETRFPDKSFCTQSQSNFVTPLSKASSSDTTTTTTSAHTYNECLQTGSRLFSNSSLLPISGNEMTADLKEKERETRTRLPERMRVEPPQ